jgi:exopolysaccharide production protein ExoQ
VTIAAGTAVPVDRSLARASYDASIVFVAFVLANLRALVTYRRYPDPSVLVGHAWIEIALWFVTALAVASIVRRDGLVAEYVSLWRRNWLLGLFVLLVLASALWSIAPLVTLFRALELLLATLIASYIGMRYGPDKMLRSLAWFGVVVLVASIGVVLALPSIAQRYAGRSYLAWRGVFWNKNHLGSIVALINIVYCCRAISAFGHRDKALWRYGFLYGLSLAVLYFAHSVTGYVVAVGLHVFVLSVWLWIRAAPRLSARYYYAAVGVAVAALIATASNLGLVFAVLDRSSNLSGRVDLWDFLVRDVIPRRLWWGHGFGAIWFVESFRVAAQHRVGWETQVVIADNGFLDLLLHVGIVGLSILLGVLIIASIRSLRFALAHKTLTDSFPLLLIVYAWIANIAFSLLAEREVFVWFLIVVVLFMTTPGSSAAEATEVSAPRDTPARC